MSCKACGLVSLLDINPHGVVCVVTLLASLQPHQPRPGNVQVYTVVHPRCGGNLNVHVFMPSP